VTPWLGTSALALCVGLFFALLAGAGVTLSWRFASGRRASRTPHQRAREAERHALAATAVPILALGGILLPGLLALVGAGDHCAGHAEHLHLCLAHPIRSLSPSLAAGAALIALLAALAGLVRAWPTLRAVAAWRRLASLRSAGVADTGFERAGSARPFSVVVGLWRPSIWISDPLWRGLGAPARAVVLAHERAHARRRDPLRRFVLALLTLPLGAETRAALLRSWTLAVEQVCDEAAAREVGDRLSVAEAIVAVERLVGDLPAPAASFGGGDAERRVHSLLAPVAPEEAPGFPLRWVGWIGGLALVLAATRALHHVTEHLLDALLR
jgi:hypothetical protein